MCLQLHLNSIEAMRPGPIDKHQMVRLLKDLDKHFGQLHSTVERIADSGKKPGAAGPEEETIVRTDLG